MCSFSPGTDKDLLTWPSLRRTKHLYDNNKEIGSSTLEEPGGKRTVSGKIVVQTHHGLVVMAIEGLTVT